MADDGPKKKVFKKFDKAKKKGGGGGAAATKPPSSSSTNKRKGGGNENKGAANDLPANKKRRTRVKRAKTKPAFDLVARAKAIWAAFRSKRMDKEEREKLAAELYGLIKGKLHQLAVKHDAARVVQCALKHGSPTQCEAYTTELLEHVMEFSKIQYAHFIVLRLLDVTANDPVARKQVLRIFSGKVHTLATHAVGAKVLEGVFSTYPKAETQAIRSELYGRETQLLLGNPSSLLGSNTTTTNRDLKSVLEELPERKVHVLEQVASLIQKMLTKDLAGLPFVQELIWEYFCCAGPVNIRKMIPNLLDYLLLLTGTRPGCKVLSECTAYGTAKDRKKMIKTLKGYVVPTFLHKDAYLLILRLADVVDDTVTFNKIIWNELLEKNESEATMLRFVTHVKASKVLLNLLAPQKRTTFLTKDELELLKPALIPASAFETPAIAAAAGGDYDEEKEGGAKGEEEGEKKTKKEKEKAVAAAVVVPKTPSSSAAEEDNDKLVPTSKKDEGIRREELLAPLKEALFEVGKTYPRELLCSAEGSFVLYEMVVKWRDEEVIERIAVAAAADGVEKEEAGEMDVDEEEDEEGEEGEDDDDAMEEGGEEEKEKETPSTAVNSNVKQGLLLQQTEAVIAASSATAEEDAGPLREHRIAYKTIKRLILYETDKGREGTDEGRGRTDKGREDPSFAEALYKQIKGKWMKWLSSIRGGFLIEALVKVPEVGGRVLGELEGCKKEMEGLAEQNLKGVKAILEMMKKGGGGGDGGKKEGKGEKKKRGVGGGGREGRNGMENKKGGGGKGGKAGRGSGGEGKGKR